MDWITFGWLAPIALAATLVALASWRRTWDWLAVGVLLLVVWGIAMGGSGLRCVWEGFEGPPTTIDGKLPVQCRAAP